MGDSVAQKMIRISEDEENISSVCSIMEDNEEDEEFNPFTANDNVSRAPTAKVSKVDQSLKISKSSSSFSEGLSLPVYLFQLPFHLS